MCEQSQVVSDLLIRIQEGDWEARNELVAILYEVIRRLSRAKARQHNRGPSLQTSDLVQEAMVRLKLDRLLEQPVGRSYLFGAASRAIEQCLIEYARKRNAIKRGREWKKQEFDDALARLEQNQIDIDALHTALTDLSRLDERQADAVRMRYFLGLANKDIAAILQVSVKTVELDLHLARAWLRAKLEG